MKSLLLSLLIALSVYHLHAQNENFDLTFVEATPIWRMTVEDTTFIKSEGQPDWNKRTSLIHGFMKRKNNHFFICTKPLETTLPPDSYGFILDKVDIKTGIRAWTHYNTKFNKGTKDYYSEINFKPNEDVELFGVETSKTARSIRKTINNSNGILQDVKISKDTIYEILPKEYYKQYVLQSDSIYLSAIQIGDDVGTVSNPVYNHGVTFRVANKYLDFLTTKRLFYNYDSLSLFSIYQPSLLIKPNAKTLVSLSYKDRGKSIINQGLKMMWTDISDPYNIKTTQILDFDKLVPAESSGSFLTHRFKTKKNTIFLSHIYPNLDLQKKIAYILWLDSVGKIKTYINIPKYKDHYYTYCDLIYANNNFAYLVSTPSIKGSGIGCDILQIQHGVDTVKFISSLTTTDESELFSVVMNELYEDGYFIIGGYCKKSGFPALGGVKIHCFKASDLGIDFKITATKEKEKTIDKFSIYPNPTTGLIFIKIDGIESQFFIKIYDQIGREIKSIPTNDRYTQIDLSNNQNGIYFVEIVDKFQNRIGKIEKFVKFE
jgi:hypothetical protein